MSETYSREPERTSPWVIAGRVVFTFALIGCIVFIFSNSMAVAEVSSMSSGRVLRTGCRPSCAAWGIRGWQTV